VIVTRDGTTTPTALSQVVHGGQDDQDEDRGQNQEQDHHDLLRGPSAYFCGGA
jgi:hypothetical protein